MTATAGVLITKDGLPREAFAIIGNAEDPETWQLPHHRKSITGATKRMSGIEKTVDWQLMPAAIAALSPKARGRQRVAASPGEILDAAKHLASHYRQAGKSLPDTLAALL